MLIYKATNTINNKIYIGLTSKSLEERIVQHKYDYSVYLHEKENSLPAFYNAVKKYGWESFMFSILEQCKNKEELCNREIFWIRELDSTNYDIGYNINTGGVGGDNYKNHPEIDKIKEKISQKVKSSNRWTEEKKLQHSINLSGDNNPMRRNPQNSNFVKNNPMKDIDNRRFGKDNPMNDPIIKQKHLEAIRKRNLSKEYREKLSESSKGKVKTEEHCNNISISKTKYWYLKYSENYEYLETIKGVKELESILKTNKLQYLTTLTIECISKIFLGYRWERIHKDEISKKNI